ncbi:MCE family protein [Myxococcota bacterium]|nr:MCE family protein [Myxococcota bacterium]MBU1242140.1 MCE family protein [Myxococcota bacterium]MBU1412669.1 MCE family protein [Myxococcota bacterium]MBU1508792.1 MCE family protein [Myxococcota bacterium]
MKDYGSAFKVGLFIVIVAFSIWYSLHAVTEGLGGARGYSVYALLRDATGLVDKSMVQIAGLRVGQITDRRLQDRLARIDIYVEKKVVMYENAAVTKKVASLMGGYYLEIDPGTPESMDPLTGQVRKNKRLGDGDQIKIVEEPVTTGDIINRAGDLIPEVQLLVQEVRKLASTGIPQLVRNTDDAIVTNSKALNQLLLKLDSITDDVKLITSGAPRDVTLILTNVRELTRELRTIVAATGGKLDGLGNSAQSSLDRVNTLLDKLDKDLTGKDSIAENTKDLTENLADITKKMKDGEGTIGKFITSATIADNIEQITSDAKNFLGGLTRLDAVVGLRTEYNLIANSVKTYISVSLYPREDKFYLIELIDDPRGSRSTRYTVTRTDNPEVGPPLSRTEELSVTDSMRFSFMFGKKIDYFTFRFGIKESTGGAGMDLHLLDNRLSIHADLFDFSANLFPRFKLGVVWEFYRRMFLVAGVDDLMNERPRTGAGGGRDFYIGAQIRFSDEDLKALLMFGGSAIGGMTGGK